MCDIRQPINTRRRCFTVFHRPSRVILIFFACLAHTDVIHAQTWKLDSVSASPESLTVNAGSHVDFVFESSEFRTCAAAILSAYGVPVRREQLTCTKGRNSYSWDRKDAHGEVVPPGAYCLFIADSSDAIKWPAADHAGIEDVRSVKLQPSNLSYKLDSPSLVLARIGIRDGPLLRTIVDWEPRPRGSVTEPWNGWDASETAFIAGREDVVATVSRVQLPEATVFLLGDENSAAKQAHVDADTGPSKRIPQQFRKSPNLLLEVIESPGASRHLSVRVDMPDAHRSTWLGDEFEILFYVDYEFIGEAERGYLPYRWRLNSNTLPPGEHVLTVNVVNYHGQIGTSSRKLSVPDQNDALSRRSSVDDEGTHKAEASTQTALTDDDASDVERNTLSPYDKQLRALLLLACGVVVFLFVGIWSNKRSPK